MASSSGELLARLQAKAGMSDLEFAKSLSIRPSTLQRWKQSTTFSAYAEQKVEFYLSRNWEKSTDWADQLENFKSTQLIVAPGAAVHARQLFLRFRSWCSKYSDYGIPSHYAFVAVVRGMDLNLVDANGRRLEETRDFNSHFQSMAIDLALRSTIEFENPDDPIEPEAGPGPQYSAVGGRLSQVAVAPEDANMELQARLHERLKQKIAALGSSLAQAGNQHPELARAASEYSELLSLPTERVDVVGIWSVGNSLSELLRAYSTQEVSKTISVPLEPQLLASLRAIARDHSAFILGFPEAEELISRADRFDLGADVFKEIRGPGEKIIGELASNADLVDEGPRAIHRVAGDAVSAVGWAANRATYSCYLHIRNAVRALIRLSVGRDPNLASVTGFITATSVIAGDPDAVMIRHALPFLELYGKELTVFFNHSADFRLYVEWALAELESEAQADRPRQ